MCLIVFKGRHACRTAVATANTSVFKSFRLCSRADSHYSAGLLASVPRTISSERLITYLRATSQDLPKALGLYEHNVHLSEALYGSLHSIEIATRNAMHYTLAANYGVPDWYDRAPLSPHWRGKVNEAKTASGVRATPGKVIAELTLWFLG